MTEPSAETAYLFRHALLREAAYELQLPTARSSLHGLAARICIDLYDQRAEGSSYDFLVEEIVRHLAADTAGRDEWAVEQQRRFTLKAAELAALQYRGTDAVRFWRDLAAIVPDSQRSLALYRAGCAARELGSGAQVAIGLLQDALECAEPTGPASDGMIRATLGFTLRQAGRPEEGTAMLEEALARSRGAKDRAGEALALQYFSTALRDSGRLEHAHELTEQAVTLHRQTGNRRGEGLALGDLGIIQNNILNFERAIDYFRQALAVFEEVGDARAAAIYTGALATSCFNLSRLDESEEAFHRAIAGHRRVGNRRGLHFTMTKYADLLTARGKVQEALRTLDEVLALMREAGTSALLEFVHASRSVLLLRQGDVTEALRDAELAVRFARQNGMKQQQAASLLLSMRCLLKAGREDDARGAWHQVAEIAAGVPSAVRESWFKAMLHDCEQAGVTPFARLEGGRQESARD
ncbi:MAG: hypothetical protein ICCCNLDF_00090 [Planctomycetes bacterium]|nr:hypothetical protein [Planctomycetota bacterium]